MKKTILMALLLTVCTAQAGSYAVEAEENRICKIVGKLSVDYFMKTKEERIAFIGDSKRDSTDGLGKVIDSVSRSIDRGELDDRQDVFMRAWAGCKDAFANGTVR